MSALVVHGFECAAAMLSLLCLGECAEPASRPSAAVTVRVYSLAPVSDSALARAEAEAGKIFQQAGIRLSWVHCGRAGQSIKDQALCSEPADLANPILRILGRLRPEPGLTDQTVGFANVSAGLANVSFDGVSELMPSVAAPRSSVLGLVAAHELGHILLQTRGHAADGIMHFPWSPKELGLGSHNFLAFTANQARSMRERTRSSTEDRQPSTR